MGLSIGGNLVVGKIQPPARPVARGIRQLIAEQLEARAAEEAARMIEEQDALPIDVNRPIFNSLIDRKENSRYMLDLVKV
jgi:hypothetical protein